MRSGAAVATVRGLCMTAWERCCEHDVLWRDAAISSSATERRYRVSAAIAGRMPQHEREASPDRFEASCGAQYGGSRKM